MEPNAHGLFRFPTGAKTMALPAEQELIAYAVSELAEVPTIQADVATIGSATGLARVDAIQALEVEGYKIIRAYPGWTDPVPTPVSLPQAKAKCSAKAISPGTIAALIALAEQLIALFLKPSPTPAA
jgi:hypothetical protein